MPDACRVGAIETTFRDSSFTYKQKKSLNILLQGKLFRIMVASHLLKLVQYLNESEGYKCSLNYLRNVDKKEVDLLTTMDGKPWFAVEVKLNETQPSPSLYYYKERLKIPHTFQVVMKKDVDFVRDDVRIMSAGKFSSGLI